MPDVETKYAEDYKEIFLNRVIGGFRDGFFEFELISELSDFEPTMKRAQFEFQKTQIKRTIHAKIIVPIYTMKTTANFFASTLENYEKTIGPIPDLPTGPGKKDTASTDPTFIK